MFQQILKLLSSPSQRRFSASQHVPSIRRKSPPVVADPAFLRFAASRCLPSILFLGRPPVCCDPSIHAASSVNADTPVHAASAILSAAPLGDVPRIGKAPSLDADAPSAIVAQIICQVNVAHVKHQNTGDRIQ